MNLRYLLVAAALVAGFWALRHWRRATKLLLFLLVFEGALRKWVVPGAQDLVYFAKDGLLIAAFAGFLVDRRALAERLVPAGPLVPLLGLNVLYALLQVFNPNLPNVLVGLLGLKAYFLYLPLLWMVPATFEDRAELWRFLRLFAWLALPLGLLALLQFASPAGSFVNAYARQSESGLAHTFGTSNHVRVTATFSYITGYVSYLFSTALLLFALLATVRWKPRGHLLLFAALGMTLLGMLMSGSRAPVLMLAVTLPLYLWSLVARDARQLSTVARVVAVAVGLGLLALYAAQEAVSAFLGRAAQTGDVAGRLLAPFLEPIALASEAGMVGYGIGATHQAATLLVDGAAFSWLHLLVEVESSRVMLELGVIGFLLVYALRLYLIGLALRQAWSLRDPFCRAVAFSALFFFLLHLPSGVVFNVTAGVFYWFFGGLLFLAVKLERELQAARAPVPAATRGLRAAAFARLPPGGRPGPRLPHAR